MLMGVDEPLRQILRAAHHPVRVYVPYGEQWHAYSLRRFKENPKIARYVLKNIFS
jgi:proline dehydrogenase